MATKKPKRRASGPSGKLTTADRKAAGLTRFEAWLPEEARRRLDVVSQRFGSKKDWLLAMIDSDFEMLEKKG